MTVVVQTIQNDTVDMLCDRNLGQTAGVTEQVLDLNPQLAQFGVLLPQGLNVVLPEIPAQQIQPILQLWE